MIVDICLAIYVLIYIHLIWNITSDIVKDNVSWYGLYYAFYFYTNIV